MEKPKPNANYRRTRAFLHYFAPALVLLLPLLLSANLQKAECLSTATPAAEGRCNGTSRITDCLPDDEEFLMESETSRRLLVNEPKTYFGRALQPPPICDAKVVGNCFPEPRAIDDRRHCTVNDCGRPGN
ncbi:uncharacterized protein LOC110012400 [Sesamum indicum]|uniref:Uncharacterized protein LOC110012400 n=1 Tax=Sesamum indicum TaxID=4182 RepID=A0A8M8V551_SESIN|nr:uncharacterized protein LOC110012400 [Sesamum indicum]